MLQETEELVKSSCFKAFLQCFTVLIASHRFTSLHIWHFHLNCHAFWCTSCSVLWLRLPLVFGRGLLPDVICSSKPSNSKQALAMQSCMQQNWEFHKHFGSFAAFWIQMTSGSIAAQWSSGWPWEMQHEVLPGDEDERSGWLTKSVATVAFS